MLWAILSAAQGEAISDRDLRPGEKFGDADLIGIPLRITISKRTLAENKVEWKVREKKEMEMVGIDEVVEKLILIFFIKER